MLWLNTRQILPLFSRRSNLIGLWPGIQGPLAHTGVNLSKIFEKVAGHRVGTNAAPKDIDELTRLLSRDFHAPIDSSMGV